jgi:DNA modification methylase
MNIEDWPIEGIKRYPGNPRKRSKKAVAKVAASIREFGVRQCIVVDEAGEIIVGHTRLDAAELLGMATFPVHQALGLSEAQKIAYRIADNRTNEESEFDENLLAIELRGLEGFKMDLSLTGFDLRQIGSYLRGGPQAGEDEVPAEAEAVTQRGDLWVLGEHRLLCGDATSAADVAAVLNGAAPLLMVADPPYGDSYDPGWRAEAGVNKSVLKIGKVQNDQRADWREAWMLFKGSIAYVWHAGRHASEVQQSIEAAGFKIRNQIVWAKDRFALSRGDYHWQHEPCWYAVRGAGHWMGDRSQSTLWTIKAREDSGHGHGTQKPVECMRRPILNHTVAGDAVYDPFLGSGTTLIACETEQRVCYGLEIEPKYCDIVVARWEKFTGKKAQRITREVAA